MIQIDESFVRESQKGHNLELVSYLKGVERFPRYGRKPSKYGTMGPEFATILTAVDSRGYCVCKVVRWGGPHRMRCTNGIALTQPISA